MNFNFTNLDFQDDKDEQAIKMTEAARPAMQNLALPRSTVSTPQRQNSSQSTILSDLQLEIENLQSKNKLHQKQLYFLESDNTKLSQEKNALFFQNKTFAEKLALLTERNDKLSQAFDHMQSEFELVREKEAASQNLLRTQSLDLQRLSRFHLKIKNTIKPYILGLKNKIQESTGAIENLTKANIDLHHINVELSKKLSDATRDLETLRHSFAVDRNSLIKTYEDQLHDLAREIVDVRSTEDLSRQENLSLKKKLEFKHALENENIRLKRETTDQSKKIAELELKLHQTQERQQEITIRQGETQEKLVQVETQLAQKDLALESTRKQLYSKIEELEKMYLRIKMFEKLNTQLSLTQTEQTPQP